MNMTSSFANYVYSMQDTIEELVTNTILPALKADSQPPATKALIACVEKTKSLLEIVIEENENETVRLRKQLEVLERAKLDLAKPELAKLIPESTQPH